MASPLSATTLALAGLAAAAPAQSVGLHLTGQGTNSDFGAAVALVDDLDGDGVDDVLVGAPRSDLQGDKAGSVFLHSGADGSLIRQHHGAAAHKLGISVAAFPDLDGDGTGDYAASAQRDNSSGLLSGYVRLWSGADGSLIREFQSASTWDRFGALVVNPGDIDGDGTADLLVSAPNDDWQGPGSGAVRIYSGADGSLLQTQYGRDPWDLFGTSACAVGDVDGDGRAAFAVGSPRAATPGPASGAVQVFSGRTGAELRRFQGRPGDVLGVSVCTVGDFDGDGLGDLASGGVDDFSSLTQRPGVVRVYSLANGQEITSFVHDRNTEGFGLAVAGLVDGNGDGYGELLVGAPHSGLVGANGLASGSARLYSGRSGRRSFEVNGDSPQDHLGTGLAPAGDFNGDGRDDFLVGEPGGNPNGDVYLYLQDPPLPITAVNLVAGQTAEVRLDGGTPGVRVDFFYSLAGFGVTEYGSGVSLDLAPPAAQLGDTIVDAAGTARVSLTVPAGVSGRRVWFQAWHWQGGATPPGRASDAATQVIG